MSNKIKLFHESDQEEPDPVEFGTNKSYAKHYDEFRKKEILAQLKNLDAGEQSSDSSNDETTDEEIVDADFDKEFFRTLAFLKRNDPNKYTEQPKFFEKVKPIEEVALTKRRRKEKPLTLKAYQRKVILEKDGVYEDEDDIDPFNEEMADRPESPSFVEQQKKIKDEIKQALSKIDDSDSDNEGKEEIKARGGGLLMERMKSKDENQKEQADYIQWLADRETKEPPTEEVNVLQPLKHFWSNEKLSGEDAFLKDYILNKRFVQNGDIPSYEDIVGTSEDEEQLEKQEEYERQYNFRFEEPDPEFIKRFPRTVEDSVRIERNKRKEDRQALKERKQKEKEYQRRELEELKAVKLQEIKERIQRLKEIAATEKLTMNEQDLESDFDPEEHDRRMQQMFNDDYYGIDEGDQKPEFPDLDEEMGIENYDKEHIDDDVEEDAGPHCEDDDFVMDCDYEENAKISQTSKEIHQQELLESTRSRKKGRRQSKFREMLKTEKPLFDPEDEKTYGEYIDEYYKLEYEDMIGNTPCRFRYVETVPNDFGLSIEEILAANTRELNRWASVRKTVQLRPTQTELHEVEMYRQKGANETMKRKILPSLFTEADIDEDEDDEIKKQKQDVEVAKSKSKNQKDLKKKEQNVEKTSMAKESTELSSNQKKRTKKLKNKVSFVETQLQHCDEGTYVEQIATPVEQLPVQEKQKKKKHKKAQLLIDAALKEDSSFVVASAPKQKHEIVPRKSKAPTDEQGLKIDQTNGSNAVKSSDSNHAQKRKWNVADLRKNDWNGSNKSRFGGQQHGGRNTNGSGGSAKRAKREETASDQRLRAFGINPRKYHNKLKYGNQQQKKAFTKTKHNKKITFE